MIAFCSFAEYSRFPTLARFRNIRNCLFRIPQSFLLPKPHTCYLKLSTLLLINNCWQSNFLGKRRWDGSLCARRRRALNSGGKSLSRLHSCLLNSRLVDVRLMKSSSEKESWLRDRDISSEWMRRMRWDLMIMDHCRATFTPVQEILALQAIECTHRTCFNKIKQAISPTTTSICSLIQLKMSLKVIIWCL